MRRRFSQPAASLQERLIAFAKDLREQAAPLPPGVELPDAEAAHDTAVGALFDAARAAILEGSTNQFYAIEVRNGIGPVLEFTAVFNSRIFRRQ